MSISQNEGQKLQPETPFWKFTKEEILKHFNQNLSGYSKEVAAKRLKEFGPNELKEEEQESIFEKIKEQFEDLLVRILLGAAVISFILALTSDSHEEGISAFIEPIVILLILIANASIGVWQDINADKAIDALKKLQATHTAVRRDNQVYIIDSKEVVPGDIVQLKEGEKIPADVRFLDIDTSNFMVNQSSFTGESRQAYKNSDVINSDEVLIDQRLNIGFGSSSVIYGQGTAIVIGTGMNTQIGKVHQMIESVEEDKSPLKKKLDEFGNYLTYVIGVICLLVWMMNFRNFYDDIHGGFFNGCVYYFKIAVALAVAAIPEGLPAVITTCLALGSRRMADCNAIVRKLDSIETLGCTNVICSDKTGTLTTNNMTATKILLLGNNGETVIKNISGISYEPVGTVEGVKKEEFKNMKNLHLMADCGAICNTSQILLEDKNYKVSGTPTEGAIRVFVEKLRELDPNYTPNNISGPMDYNDFISKNYEILFHLEFDRDRKSMGMLAVDKRSDKTVLFIKGAPEFLIKKASHYLDQNGNKKDLKDDLKNKLLNTISESFLKNSLRTLAFCIRDDLPEFRNIDVRSKEQLKQYFKDLTNFSKIENGCSVIGFTGIVDPPRKEVKEAINTCKKAGIKVIMITGDNKITADAVGKEIGIIDESNVESRSWIASEFFKIPVDTQVKLLKENFGLIFSRSEPKHKMDLITLLKKKCDYVVAMTGDGVNDAAALAESNIGIAMGKSGTEVAKEASHMILADDNFASIVQAIGEGRSIYMNMKAFIRYLISSNIGEVVSIFLTSVFGIPEAFTSIQLLWVNLVTDGPPATALGFNPRERNIMQKPPRSNSDSLLTKWVIIRYFIIGFYVGVATVAIFIYWYLYFEHTDGHSLIQWSELTTWMQCEKWTGFKVNSFDGIDLSTNPCNYFSIGKKKPVTMSLSVLVVIEMFNAMNAISDEGSVFVVPPYKNPWLIVAITFSMSLHCVILYIPFFSSIFGLAPLDLVEWKIVLLFSFPVVILDEIMKLISRYSSKKEENRQRIKQD